MKEQLYDIYRNKRLTAKFGIIGGVGFISNYLILKLCTDMFSLNRITGELLAAAVALQVTFILHDRWTYKIDETQHVYQLSFGKRYRAYVISNSFGSLLTVLLFALFSLFFGHFVALALAACGGLVWNFLVNKAVIWHHKPQDES